VSDYLDLLRTMERAQEQIRSHLLVMPPGWSRDLKESTAAEINMKREAVLPTLLSGMRVVESALARMPVRMHKRRRWMSDAYHRRIQKKWNKRYGYAPAAFILNEAMLRGLWHGPLPTIRKRDLSAFSKDCISVVVGVA